MDLIMFLHNHPILTPIQNSILCEPVTNSEIWETIKGINPYKAPGPDGLQAIFFHKYWNIVGEEVCKFVKNCFITHHVPEEINKTFISLFPKMTIRRT